MNYKIFTFVLLAFFITKKGFSQEKNREIAPAQLTLPETYYKGQEEKRRYAETHKPNGVMTPSVVTSISPTSVQRKNETEDTPDIKARKLLNTDKIPADFPKYVGSMSEREYENKVGAWFKANPSYRKLNK